MTKPQWQTLSSKLIYKNPYIAVYEDQVIRPSGEKGIYGYVKEAKSIGIIPLDKDQNIYLCKNNRYLFKNSSWEIPRGLVDKGETYLQAAKRELIEESGIVAKKFTFLGTAIASPGLFNEEPHIFLAEDLTISTQKDPHQEIKIVQKFSLAEAITLIKSNKINDQLAITSIFLTKLYLNI